MLKSIPHLIRDEKQAIKDYSDSAKNAKHNIAKAKFSHIEKEEKGHAKELADIKKKIAKKLNN